MPIMAKDKKSKHGQYKGKQAPFRTKQELIDALSRCAEDERRTRNTMIEILLEEGLAKRGYWPPQQPPAAE